MEACSLCEEVWEVVEEMTESERKRKRKQICLSLDADFCEDVARVSQVLGLDQSRVIEMCLRYGQDKAMPVLKRFAEEFKKLEEGQFSGGEEWEEGGESQEEKEEEGGEE